MLKAKKHEPIKKSTKVVKKPIEVKVEPVIELIVEPKVEVKVEVKPELPTFENTKVVKILVENDSIQKGHHLCKMENGTTMHVPIHLFK